ncbi:MAG: hypothetical protein HC895_02925 [Leptolyngbyaceae cyanobacterium SM1_3_5]|nr:hypothetical protein [Leptolyngbyaceae cyanobacterium SM1_3_5]
MSFNENGGATPPVDPPANSSQDSGFRHESVKFLLTGEPKAIQVAIHVMHRLNFISGSEWSRPIALKDSNEVIVVAERSFLVT